MTYQQLLLEDMKVAMKAREAIKLGAIRLLLSEVKNTEIDFGQLDEAGFHKVVAKLVKQVREGIEEFEKAGRGDTVEEEKQKLAVLESYLPQQMSDDELKGIVAEVKSASPELPTGQLIGAVLAKVNGQADGKRVAQMIAQLK